jgi:hypothetical protein
MMIPWNFAYKRRPGGLFLQRFWYAKFPRFFWGCHDRSTAEKNLGNFAYKTLTDFLHVICNEFLQELLVNGEASCEMLFHAPYKKEGFHIFADAPMHLVKLWTQLVL